MIAAITPSAAVPALERIDTDSLFKRLDSDGNGRLTVADRASAVLKLTTRALARYAHAANHAANQARQLTDQQALPSARAGSAASARYQAVQAFAA